MRSVVISSSVALFALGCSPEPISLGEDADADAAALTAKQACAIVKLANTADLATLDDAVKLDRRAAEGIYELRSGPDGVVGTVDDGWFATVADVDDVSYVGKSALAKMKKYAKDNGVACGDVDVQVLAFNDFHGAMEPPAGSGGRVVVSKDPAVPPVNAGGAEFLATHLKALEAQNPNTVIAAAGDIIGATPLLSSAFHDEPTIESVNLMGLDVAGVGNHEFDEGVAELWRMQDGGCHPVDGCQDGDGFDGAAFPYLAANVELSADGTTVFPSYHVKQFGNARVGFVGVTLENTPSVVTKAGTEGLSFFDEADAVNALVPELQARGVNTIVVLIHEGGVATGLYDTCEGISGPIFEIVSRLDPAVDVVVSGHTNAAHLCEMNGKLVTSAAHNGRLVTDIDLVVNELTGDVVTMKADNVIVTRDVAKDADQTGLIAKYKSLVAPIANRVVGSAQGDLTRTASPAGEMTMGSVIADAQLEATQAAGQGGAVIALMNPGGVRADLVASLISGGEATGEITYGEAFSVQPFANNLVTVTVTGAQIEQILEQQWLTEGVDRSAKPMILQVSAGFSYQWDPTRPAGDKVSFSSITLNGQPLQASASYRVTINAFLADGGDGFTVFKQATDRLGGGIDLEALEAYLAAHSPVAVPALGRISVP